MIRSGVFTFDESSIWDPKLIREYLNIPEDQLNILENLPEWSKDTDNSNTFGIEKDSIFENSQSTKFTTSATLERKKDINKQNIELFDENFECRRKILDTYKLNASKLSRSISLFEIDKINKISSSSSPLKSSSSVPNIYLFSETLYSKYLNSGFKSKDSPPERHSSSLIKSIDLPVTKNGGITYIAIQTSTGISKSNRKGDTCIEKSKMEVDSQLPTAIPCYVDNIRNNGSDTEILVENNTVSASLTLKSPNKLNLSPNNEPTSSLKNASKFGNSCSFIQIKAINLPKPDSSNSCDKNETDIVKEPITSINCTPDVSTKVTELAEQDGSTSCEKNEPGVNTVEDTNLTEVNSAIENKRVETNMDFKESAKATLCEKNERGVNIVEDTDLTEVNSAIENNRVETNMDFKESTKATSCEKNEPDVNIVENMGLTEVNSAIENKRVETNMDFKESDKANKTSDQCSGLLVSKELCASKVNKVSSHESGNKISSDLNYTKMDVQNGQQTIHQNISDNKLEFAQTLSIKRKLESKNRSSKRRKNTAEKQSLDKRSLKKAGEICYSAEHIKTMLDIIKQFS